MNSLYVFEITDRSGCRGVREESSHVQEDVHLADITDPNNIFNTSVDNFIKRKRIRSNVTLYNISSNSFRSITSSTNVLRILFESGSCGISESTWDEEGK